MANRWICTRPGLMAALLTVAAVLAGLAALFSGELGSFVSTGSGGGSASAALAQRVHPRKAVESNGDVHVV